MKVGHHDVVVLNRDLPGTHGDDIYRQIAVERAETRILMPTAAAAVHDRVEGLTLGVDDYLGKPFDFAELVARVRALGRRCGDGAQRTEHATGREPAEGEGGRHEQDHRDRRCDQQEMDVGGVLGGADHQASRAPRALVPCRAESHEPKVGNREGPDAEKEETERVPLQFVAHNVTGGRVGRCTRTLAIQRKTGPVIPEADLEGLFEPFRKGGHARSKPPEGQGLGLAIVRSVATAHGAEVAASTRPLGGLDVVVRFAHPPA